jgi:predicted nucleic acid-binding protein
MIGHCVVDASVGIKLFVREQFTDVVEGIFAGLGQEPPVRLYVPDLFYTECANILWKYVRRFNYAAEEARSDLVDLRQLNLGVVATDDLLTSAFDLAVEYNLTVYDACYVALASTLELPLLTADEQLVNKMKGQPHDIRWIGDVGFPSP